MDALNKIFGINYGTTILGIGVIFAAVGRVAVAWRTKDFTALATDGQLIMTTAASILTGLGLLVAKDRNVSGAGNKSVSVDSDGVVTNTEGKEIATLTSTPAKSVGEVL